MLIALRRSRDEKNDETDYKMLQTLTVKDEEPLNSARDVRKVMQANYHSRCGQRSYSKERNCLDDAAFANTDMISGTYMAANPCCNPNSKQSLSALPRRPFPNLLRVMAADTKAA
ncbi:hypothetical protein Tco_1312895 [Tanacetum coccineum]